MLYIIKIIMVFWLASAKALVISLTTLHLVISCGRLLLTINVNNLINQSEAQKAPRMYKNHGSQPKWRKDNWHVQNSYWGCMKRLLGNVIRIKNSQAPHANCTVWTPTVPFEKNDSSNFDIRTLLQGILKMNACTQNLGQAKESNHPARNAAFYPKYENTNVACQQSSSKST